MDASKQLIDGVMARMSDTLTAEQMTLLEAALIVNLHGCRVDAESYALAPSAQTWEWYLQRFRATKRLQNCSEKTLRKYDFTLAKLREMLNKPPQEITDGDIKYFLAMYGERRVVGHPERKVSKGYLNNARLDLSAFFSWMTAEGYIARNPVANVPSISYPKTIKRAYTGQELEALKYAACPRDRALLAFLDATGCRIGEAVAADRETINWQTMSAIIYGTKGKAEREVYITEEAAYHLQTYLDARTDVNPALFVGVRAPYERLTVSGAEASLRKLGRGLSIHAHPHKSRRTMITRLNKRGMPLQTIQQIAGHAKPETTQIYIDAAKTAVRAAYERCT